MTLRLICSLLLLFICSPSHLFAANIDGIEIITPDEVKPGDTGYGLTVFSGYKVEKFNARVIDVVRKFMPGLDLILMETDHPRIQQTGLVAGMSGSPVYINGKLAGALAYGWAFGKEPVFGVTPISDMLGLTKMKPRGPEKVEGPNDDKVARANAAKGAQPASTLSDAETKLVPLAVPLASAGFSAEALEYLNKSFAPLGLKAGTSGGAVRKVDKDAPAKFENGGSIAVQLVSGDMSLAGVGTVTAVVGKKVIGFGHPMFNLGEVYFPVSTAKIHHIIATYPQSFKLGTPVEEKGTLVQDRQPGIMADTSQHIPMIPISMTIRTGGVVHKFNVKIARHRFLLSSLIIAAMASGLQRVVSDVTDVTYSLKTSFKATGIKPISVEERRQSDHGLGLDSVLFARGMFVLDAILSNPYRRVELEELNLDLDVDYGLNVAQLLEVKTSRSIIHAGKPLEIIANFRKPNSGKEFERRYTIDIPESMAGSLLTVDIIGGAHASMDKPTPENLDQLVENITKSYPSRSVLVRINTPDQNLSVRGQMVEDLPTSVMDSLQTSTDTRAVAVQKLAVKKLFPEELIMLGEKQLRIRVEPTK